jgi:hypothetical protein
MAEVKRLLSMTRLLTVTGAGGSGKTRLALEVARDLAGAYSDGVWLLELAGISEYELVPQAVAAALGVTERPGETLSQTLVDVLGARQTLLVLDNCEHLVEAVASLVDTLLDLGCAVELRGAVGLQHTPAEDAMREPYLEGARSRLDGATWEALWTSSERVNPTMGRESVVSVGRRAPGSATTTKRATE